MSLLHKIIKKTLAKQYFAQLEENGPIDFEEACTCDPEDGPFYLHLGLAPKLIRDLVNWTNRNNDDYPFVKGLLCFNDRIDIHALNVLDQMFCVYPLNPMIRKKKYFWKRKGTFFYDGRRIVNGKTVLAYHRPRWGENKVTEYITEDGNTAFTKPISYPKDWSEKSQYTKLFDEVVLNKSFYDANHVRRKYFFISDDSCVLYRPLLGSFEQCTLDGKDYIYGPMSPDLDSLNCGLDHIINLCDRDGNLYAGHGGPFYGISRLSFKLFDDKSTDLIYAKKRIDDIFRFYDRKGNTVEAFGIGKPGRTLWDIVEHDGSLYSLIKDNKDDTLGSKVYSYDGTDMLIDYSDMDQLLPFVREYVGDDDFDNAFAGFYEHLYAFGKENSDIKECAIALLMQVEEYAVSQYEDRDERIRCITDYVRSMDDGIFNLFDNLRDKGIFTGKDEDTYRQLEGTKNVWIKKIFSNIERIPKHLGTGGPAKETESYLEYVTEMLESHPRYFKKAIDHNWYLVYKNKRRNNYFDELLGFLEALEYFPLHLKNNSGFESQINEFIYDMDYLTDNPDNDFFDPSGMIGWLNYLKDKITDEKSGMLSYLSTISFERFSKVGFTQYIMLDSYGLLEKYEMMSISLDNLNLGQRELYQAHDSISETMDMVLERSKRRHTSPRDDISEFLDNVNRSFIDAPNMSVEYMMVAA